jgi:hypothetical protein
MAFIYTSRSSTEPGGVPAGWGDNPYPGLRYGAYPTEVFADNQPPTGYTFPNGFPLSIGDVGLGTSDNAIVAIVADTITISLECQIQTSVGVPLDGSLNHLIQVTAQSGVLYLPIKYAGGSFQDALWIKSRKYSTSPKYGFYEKLVVDVTGLAASDEVLVTCALKTLTENNTFQAQSTTYTLT